MTNAVTITGGQRAQIKELVCEIFEAAIRPLGQAEAFHSGS